MFLNFKAYVHFLAYKVKDVFRADQNGGMGWSKAGNGVIGKRIREETNRSQNEKSKSIAISGFSVGINSSPHASFGGLH